VLVQPLAVTVTE
jgi:hypothetical protein